VGLHTCTAVARSLCVSWAFLFTCIDGRAVADVTWLGGDNKRSVHGGGRSAGAVRWSRQWGLSNGSWSARCCSWPTIAHLIDVIRVARSCSSAQDRHPHRSAWRRCQTHYRRSRLLDSHRRSYLSFLSICYFPHFFPRGFPLSFPPPYFYIFCVLSFLRCWYPRKARQQCHCPCYGKLTSVPICNRSHARRVNSGKITIS